MPKRNDPRRCPRYAASGENPISLLQIPKGPGGLDRPAKRGKTRRLTSRQIRTLGALAGMASA